MHKYQEVEIIIESYKPKITYTLKDKVMTVLFMHSKHGDLANYFIDAYADRNFEEAFVENNGDAEVINSLRRSTSNKMRANELKGRLDDLLDVHRIVDS